MEPIVKIDDLEAMTASKHRRVASVVRRLGKQGYKPREGQPKAEASSRRIHVYQGSEGVRYDVEDMVSVGVRRTYAEDGDGELRQVRPSS